MKKTRNLLMMALAAGMTLLSLAIVGGCSTPNATKRKPAQDAMPGMNMAALPLGNLAQCTQIGPLSQTASTQQVTAVNAIIAQHSHRLQHALWHAMRSNPNQTINDEVLKAFGPQWTQEHHYCQPAAPANNPDDPSYNPVGEDFLYMHRQMVGIVRGALVNNEPKLPCLAGWTAVPDSNHGGDMMPGGKQAKGPKSDATLAQLLTWDSYFQGKIVPRGPNGTPCPNGQATCNWLTTVSLSQLGMAIELTTHNNLHMRYATDQPPAGFAAAAKTGGAPLPYNDVFPSKWNYDQPGYNWLADPYGAAVNPIFWKIHGYVDSLIDKWAAANNKIVVSDCTGQPANCYQWKGTWSPLAPDEGAAAAALANFRTPPADEETVTFNQERMRRQWHGVLGKPSWDTKAQASTTTKAAMAPAPAPPPPSDPFEAAVQSECSGS